MISPIPGGPVSELCRTLERIRGPLEEGAAGDDGYPTHVAPRVASTATLGPPTVTRATLHSAASSSRHDVIVYRVSWSRDASVGSEFDFLAPNLLLLFEGGSRPVEETLRSRDESIVAGRRRDDW